MKKIIKMENLDCANCAAKMEDAIRKIDGVQNVSINFMMQRLILEAEDKSWETVAPQIKKACKKVDPHCVLNF